MKPEIDYFSIEDTKLEAFYIGKMEAENFVVPNPVYHRHSFHEIIWLQTGTGSHIIDNVCYELFPNTISLIRKGQVHKFNELRNVNGYNLRFTGDFLPDLNGREAEIYANLFTLSTIPNPLPLSGPLITEVERLFELLVSEYFRENAAGKKELLRHLLMAYLIKIERLRLEQLTSLQAANEGQEDAGEYQTFERFFTLLEEHYRREHNVEFYAARLNLSTRHLAGLLQKRTGKPPKRLIVERLLLEAKRLLSFTDLPVKQIALSLGYNDPFHFSKLFKQETGLAPQGFRER